MTASGIDSARLGPDSSELRKLSRNAAASVEQLEALGTWLTQNPQQSGDVVTRPHPLLLMIRRGALIVIVAPANVWDKGRDLFKPFAEKFAAFEARLILLGRAADPDLNQALNFGLCALLAVEPSHDELRVALHQAFELMEDR